MTKKRLHELWAEERKNKDVWRKVPDFQNTGKSRERVRREYYKKYKKIEEKNKIAIKKLFWQGQQEYGERKGKVLSGRGLKRVTSNAPTIQRVWSKRRQIPSEFLLSSTSPIFLRALVGRAAPELMRKRERVRVDGKNVCVGPLCCTAAISKLKQRSCLTVPIIL